ncbi:hypothetical protein ACKFKG_14965 [Phormidesmis sp. 146-35]
MKSFSQDIITHLFSLINKKRSIVKNAPLESIEAKNASHWITFKDGSGCLKQYVRSEGIYVPVASELIGLFISPTKWQSNFVYVFNENNKCLFAACISSDQLHKIQDVLRDISSEIECFERKDEEAMVERILWQMKKNVEEFEIIDFEVEELDCSPYSLSIWFDVKSNSQQPLKEMMLNVIAFDEEENEVSMAKILISFAPNLLKPDESREMTISYDGEFLCEINGDEQRLNVDSFFVEIAWVSLEGVADKRDESYEYGY